MTVLTGVGGIICAAHRDEAGTLHGHSYEVTAWFPAIDDAVELQRLLSDALAHFDHAELVHELMRAEELAEAIGALLPKCVQIDISRPLERLHARWIA